MQKKPKLSFQRPVETQEAVEEPVTAFEPVTATRMEKRLEYEAQEQVEQPTQLEVNIENYIHAFIYFSNYCKEKELPSEFVMVLWNLFMTPPK